MHNIHGVFSFSIGGRFDEVFDYQFDELSAHCCQVALFVCSLEHDSSRELLIAEDASGRVSPFVLPINRSLGAVDCPIQLDGLVSEQNSRVERSLKWLPFHLPSQRELDKVVPINHFSRHGGVCSALQYNHTDHPLTLNVYNH